MHDRPILPTNLPRGRRLRVLLVDPNANTPPYDRALGRALANVGCDVELLTSRFLYEELEHPRELALNEQFFSLAGSGLAGRVGLAHRPAPRRALKAAEYPLDWLLTLARLMRRRPDVVHVQWSFLPEIDLLLWRLLKRRHVPLVYTAHNLLPHDARPTDAARYGRLYRAANAVVVHSRRSALALHTGWGIPAERITVAPHGPLLEAIAPLERAEARRRLGLPLDAEILLFAGLIEPYKGLADLIAAFGTLAARWPLARLVVAGKPNEPFGAYRQQLHALGLLDRTTVDLRFLPEPELAAHLCAADVVALPYRAATSSGILAAARRFGCPVVATSTGDLAEVIADGESGLLVPPSRPARLGAAIERLLADPALARRLGQAGQEAAFGPAGWGDAALRTVALYHRLNAPSPPGRGPG
jgi:glycosyltransferase involved in cell wall biosynthesis